MTVGQKLQHDAATGVPTPASTPPISATARSTPDVELPFTNEEAEFLIGLAFRRSLQAILWTQPGARGSRRAADRAARRCGGCPRTRRSATTRSRSTCTRSCCPTTAIGSAPSRRRRSWWRRTICTRSPDRLRGNPKLRVFANRNDFLTSDEDVEWLTEVVGARTHALLPDRRAPRQSATSPRCRPR